jgi:excisionase family DNA binding protein
MSLDVNEPKRKPRRRRRVRPAVERMSYSPLEWATAHGLSRPTVYRMMADGRLRYVQMGERMRRIPASEETRLFGTP